MCRFSSLLGDIVTSKVLAAIVLFLLWCRSVTYDVVGIRSMIGTSYANSYCCDLFIANCPKL